jgi:cytochrome P450
MSTVASRHVDIYDPGWYAEHAPHETFSELRRTDPVHWQDMPGEPGYWAVLRHADVVHVARHPELFSSWLGGVMLEAPEPVVLEQTRHMLLVMDPPKHTAYRQPLAPHFGARVIGRMEDQIRDRCRAILELAAERSEVDFVHEVAGPLPAKIIGAIMGLPDEDTPMIQRWADLQISGQDDEVTAGHEGNASMEMAMYGAALAAERRNQPPREDITSLLLESTFDDGEQMSDIDFGSFFVQLVTAGNDTTKTMMSSGTYELVRHPEQLAALRDDHSLIPAAVEEMLRFCNPVHYLRRTAAQDVELGGKQIRAGDKVGLIYTSANRDEDVFVDSQRFDVPRTPNPHLSFGIGAHFCLGAHLARLEARIFFEELLSTFRTIELTGEPAKVRSNLNNGFKRMPVRLVR